MKRIVVLVLLVAMFATTAFADDAKVLPRGISRVTFVPVFAFVQGLWDAEGEQFDNEDNAADQLPDEMIFLFGGAYEYGLTNQISLGLQWAPAYQFAVDADATGTDDYDAQAKGFEQIDVGAEIQVLGEQGYVPNEMFRFSATPGVGIALPAFSDWSAAGTDIANQNSAPIPGSVNRSEFQVGLLLNFDYVINDTFEWNVFTEGRYKFGRTADVSDFYNAFIAEAAAGTPGYNGEDAYSTYDITYGPRMSLEVGTQPKAHFQVAESVRLDVSVSGVFALDTVQKVETDVELDPTFGALLVGAVGADPAAAALGVVADDFSVEPDDPSYVFSIEPEVGAFITALPLPLEFVASYNIGLFGQNQTQAQRLILKLRAFF